MSEQRPRIPGSTIPCLPTPTAALRIALCYSFVATLWIYGSGWMVHRFVSNEDLAHRLETLKGEFFVLVTGLLLWLALNQYFRWIRQSAEQLRESEERLRAIGDNLPDSYVYQYTHDPSGKPAFSYLSAGFTRVHGLPVEQVIAEAGPLLAQLNPAQKARLAEAEEASARALSDFGLELEARRPDGAIRRLYLRSRPRRLPNGHIHWDGIATDITDRIHAEDELRASEKRFRALVEMAPEAIFVRTQDRFSYLNAAALQLFGAAGPDELLGQKVLERFHRDCQAEALSLMQRLNESDESVRMVDRSLVKLDGSRVQVSISAAPIKYQNQRSVLVFARDITDRHMMDAALQQQLHLQTQLARVAATVPGVIYSFHLDRHGKASIPYASQELRTLFGLSSRDLRQDASPLLAAIHPADAPRIHKSITLSADTLKPWNEEFRVHKPEGKDVWIEGRSVPQPEPDGSVLWHGFLQDVTERKQLEAQFRQAQKMEGIGQLAGGVAHDFNNILAAMLMQVDLLSTEDIPDPMREGLKQIRVSAQRAANLTRQLLLFSRRQVMQAVDVDLNEAVLGLAKMLRRIIGEDIRLHLQLHPMNPLTHADPGMLDQVLLNLAVNARDAMSSGGQLIIETSEKILNQEEAQLQADVVPGKYVCLSVRDTGCGIPPEIMPRIFEPFFTTKEVGKGTGLGLATVFGIVKQHRGWINVASTPGQGSTFEVFIPALATPAPLSAVPVAVPTPRGGNETILVCEDDTALRLLMRLTLQRHGYTVIEAANGLDALQRWQDHQASVSLLLTDLVMPNGVSGHHLARQLVSAKPGLKVIYTSGYSPELAGRELDLCPDENFIAKPCTPDQLLSLVRKCLDS